MSDASLTLPDWRTAPSKLRIPRPPRPKSKFWALMTVIYSGFLLWDVIHPSGNPLPTIINVVVDVFFVTGAWRWTWKPAFGIKLIGGDLIILLNHPPRPFDLIYLAANVLLLLLWILAAFAFLGSALLGAL